MKLLEFRQIIGDAVAYAHMNGAAENAEVEILIGEDLYTVTDVSQFHVKPDVTIHAKYKATLSE